MARRRVTTLNTVQGDEAFYAYTVDNQSIVVPETIDAIRDLTGQEKTAKILDDENRPALGNSGWLVWSTIARVRNSLSERSARC